MENTLRENVAAIIGATPEEIPGDANLVYLGVGSLEMMRLVTKMRRQGITLDFSALAADPTLDAWEGHLREAVQ
ncbi:phosphopantetheine-binding protein [Nonomuraea diastatica]|uniref:Phosphopantetheine-binding protein n=1 Tax=Nonomuraea diastatica TaxID=1848329 RepID=A0A4R4WN19_9ACTN|nr:phosphopantetheine-binding protein [Nonomuraea diastatica]TDD17255.1 phosphopantetheine-binding protein [Nonomuraea diastatica]